MVYKCKCTNLFCACKTSLGWLPFVQSTFFCKYISETESFANPKDSKNTKSGNLYIVRVYLVVAVSFHAHAALCFFHAVAAGGLSSCASIVSIVVLGF